MRSHEEQQHGTAPSCQCSAGRMPPANVPATPPSLPTPIGHAVLGARTAVR
jgi:hypothetical protein